MSDKLRIAQVLAGASQGGAENFFVRLVSGLNDRTELTQQAFIRNHPHRIEALQNAGVATSGYRFGGKLDWPGHWAFRKALKTFSPDVVMTWMGRASGNTPASKKYLLINRLGHYYKLKYYQHADYWVGISKGICQHMIDGGFPAKRVFYIPNFADETPVQAIPRDSFNTPKDQPLLLAAGRLHINKGFDVLFHSLVDIPQATLWLAGAGPEEKNLKALAHSLGINERVRFLGWRNDVTALMKSVDVFVCPSRHEGLGSIVMESWAHQCPIVATNSQGPGEVIQDGISGLITPIDEAKPLTQAIQKILNNADLREHLVQCATEVYNQGFSKSHIINEYVNLYQELTNRNP
ncbi:MAG: glycosyltransferase [Pseudomonadales bacterium]|nr:glycosyltransferase [Pseudomonadales bacterium]